MPRDAVQHVVFVAGATDVDRLIVATLRIIASLDKVLCPTLGMTLRGVRGLDVAPAGWGRPQERINPLVRSCDLFIGIVSRRFGHPTGVASSGTVEEYDIASELRRVSGRSPEILLFFRRIPAAARSPPNADLDRIREFKQRIADELLWVEFDSEEEFRVLCWEQMIAYILSKGTPIGAPADAAAGSVRGADREVMDEPEIPILQGGGTEDGSGG